MDEASPMIKTVCRKRHVIPLGRRLAYSVGHVLNDLCASLWFTYLLIYLQSVLQFTNRIAGALILVGQVADAISTPLVGYESDRAGNRCFLCRYGQRKSWHLVGTLCVAATFPFLFTLCIGCSDSTQAAQFAYYAAFIIIFQFGWASTQVSHLSLIPVLTPISSERVELNALRYAMTVMSNILVYGTMWLVLGIKEDAADRINPKDAPVFQHVTLSMVGLGLFFSVIFHVFVKEHQVRIEELSSQHEVSTGSGDEVPHLEWRDWFTQPQFYMVAVLYMATRLYINLSQVYMPLYIQEGLGLHKENIAIIPLVIYISSFSSSFIMKYLSTTLGNKKTYFIGCVFALVSCCWIYFGQGDMYRSYEVYVVSVLLGVAGSTLLIISLSFTSDLIANSTTSGAFVFGSMSFVDKLANGIAVIVIQNLHPCQTNSCCEACKWFYKYILVFVCGGAVVVGLCALASLLPQTVGVRHNEKFLRSRAASRSSLRIPDYISSDDEEGKKPLLGNNRQVQDSYDDDDDDEHENCYIETAHICSSEIKNSVGKI